MLRRIGDITLLARDFCGLHPLIQYSSRRADEGLSSAVFLIARLFADKHDDCIGGAFAEDSLGGVAIQFASLALRCRPGQQRQLQLRRQKIRRRSSAGAALLLFHALHFSFAKQWAERGILFDSATASALACGLFAEEVVRRNLADA